jgi:hypothetical protein
MTSLDDPGSGMVSVHGSSADPVVLQIDHRDDLYRRDGDIRDRIVDCSSFVHWRRMEKGDPPILMLSFYRSPR